MFVSSGFSNRNEKAALTKCGLISEQFPDLFDALDADSSGAISYSQFLAATMEAQQFDESTCVPFVLSMSPYAYLPIHTRVPFVLACSVAAD